MKKTVTYQKSSGNALNRVRKYFPNVASVSDATDRIKIKVIKEDSLMGRKKQPTDCALARACVREGKADGAIIGIGYSYLIKGDHATRYQTSVSVGREITSFDRHQDFAPGKDYILSKVCPTAMLGRKRSRKRKHWVHKGSKAPVPEVHTHHTARIRVAKAQ